MSELFASGRIVDFVLGFMVLEWAAVRVLRPRLAQALFFALVPGAFLLLALRAALVGAAWHWIAALLGAALLGHLADLYNRTP